MSFKLKPKTVEMLVDLGFEPAKISRGYIETEDICYRIWQRVQQLESTHDSKD